MIDGSDISQETQLFEERNRPVPFKKILTDATLSSNVSVPSQLRSIDLSDGNFGKLAEDLLDEGLKDPRGLERGVAVYTTPERKVLVPNIVAIGNKRSNGHSVNIPIDVGIIPNREFLPRLLRQRRFLAALIHSHGAHDLPPSPQDLEPLFIPDDDPHALPLIMIITTDRKIVVARTTQTPRWSSKVIQEKIHTWESALSGEVKKQLSSYYGINRNREIESRVQTDLLKARAREHHLLIFSGYSTDDIVTLQSN